MRLTKEKKIRLWSSGETISRRLWDTDVVHPLPLSDMMVAIVMMRISSTYSGVRISILWCGALHREFPRQHAHDRAGLKEAALVVFVSLSSGLETVFVVVEVK